MMIHGFNPTLSVNGGPPRSLAGVEIRVMDLAPLQWVQVRFPRTKKKRIRRKWAKDRRNYVSVPDPARCYLVGPSPLSCVMICNPLGFLELQRELELRAAESLAIPTHVIQPPAETPKAASLERIPTPNPFDLLLQVPKLGECPLPLTEPKWPERDWPIRLRYTP